MVRVRPASSEVRGGAWRVYMLTVVVITDEPLIEAGLRAVLSESPEFTLLASLTASAEYRHASLPAEPDLIVHALSAEQRRLLVDLRRLSPRSALVLVRRDFSPQNAYQALEIGVRGLVRSTASPNLILECLTKAGCGELWMENALSIMLLDTRPVRLSKRQSELIYLLTQGLKNKEIAKILGISEGTVKAYLTALFEKVGAKDRFELALFGLKHLHDFNGERRPD
jgi:two-component system, NarL family, nitrate/nitrite response regulator NarL